jgi:hypothetical protein
MIPLLFVNFKQKLRKNYVGFGEMEFTMKRAGERAGEVTADAWRQPLPDPFSQISAN